MWVWSLGRDDPLEEGITTHSMATHSSILALRIPWIEEPGRWWSTGLQRVRHDWSNLAYTHMLKGEQELPRQRACPSLLSTYYVPGTISDTGVRKMNKQVPFLKELTSSGSKTIRTESNKDLQDSEDPFYLLHRICSFIHWSPTKYTDHLIHAKYHQHVCSRISLLYRIFLNVKETNICYVPTSCQIICWVGFLFISIHSNFITTTTLPFCEETKAHTVHVICPNSTTY